MKRLKSKKKYTLLLLFFIVVIFLTYYNIFNENSVKSIVSNLFKINYLYIIICFFIVLLYFLLQGLYTKLTLKILQNKISLKKTVFYSMAEFYFSGITPSSTGGQPVELYYMTKDKIPIRKSYITLLLNTIFFKLILIIFGVLALIFKPEYIFDYSVIYIVFFILGFLVDITMIIICSMLIFKQKNVKSILNWIIKVGNKIKILKNKVSKIDKNEVLNDYKEELKYIRRNKKLIVLAFLITFIQRICLFSIAYIVYRSLGLNTYSYFDLLFIQISVQIAIEALPIPGGTGLSEKTLQTIFITVFGLAFADTAMLLTRTFSFYIPLILSGIVVLIHIIINRKKEGLFLK